MDYFFGFLVAIGIALVGVSYANAAPNTNTVIPPETIDFTNSPAVDYDGTSPLSLLNEPTAYADKSIYWHVCFTHEFFPLGQDFFQSNYCDTTDFSDAKYTAVNLSGNTLWNQINAGYPGVYTSLNDFATVNGYLDNPYPLPDPTDTELLIEAIENQTVTLFAGAITMGIAWLVASSFAFRPHA